MLSGSGDIKLRIVIKKISKNGFDIIMPNRLLIGVSVVMNVNLPTYGDVLSWTGEVISVTPSRRYKSRYLTCVKFTHFSDEQKDILHTYLEFLTNQPKKMKVPFLSTLSLFGKNISDGENERFSPIFRFVTYILFLAACFYLATLFFSALGRYLDKTGIWGIHY